MSSQETHPMVRTVASTQSEMTEIVLPNDTNVLGNLLGGRLMHFIDLTGAMAALPAFAHARGDGGDGPHRLYPAGAPGRSGDAQVEREPGVYELDGSGREGLGGKHADRRRDARGQRLPCVCGCGRARAAAKGSATEAGDAGRVAAL